MAVHILVVITGKQQTRYKQVGFLELQLPLHDAIIKIIHIRHVHVYDIECIYHVYKVVIYIFFFLKYPVTVPKKAWENMANYLMITPIT